MKFTVYRKNRQKTYNIDSADIIEIGGIEDAAFEFATRFISGDYLLPSILTVKVEKQTFIINSTLALINGGKHEHAKQLKNEIINLSNKHLPWDKKILSFKDLC